MPGAFEVDQAGQRQEIADIVFNIRADETPLTSLVPKDRRPAQKISIWQTETYDKVGIDGVPDGEDVTKFNHQPREELQGVTQKFREPWMVSDFAQETDVAGLASEKARQKAIAAKKLKFAMEGRFCSNEELAKEPENKKNLTRGAFRWLSPTAQSKMPVPAAFRPHADCIYTGTLANLSESAFENLVIAAYMARRGKVNIDLFAGVLAQRVIDNFTVRDTDGGVNLFPVRTFNQNAKDRKMIKAVSVLEFSYGTVRCHPSTFLYLNEDGSDSDRTHRAFLGLDLSMWRLAFRRQPRMVELPDMGGGPRGFSDAMAILKCMNPLGQFAGTSES